MNDSMMWWSGERKLHDQLPAPGCCVLELGAGSGLVSATAAILGASVCATDLPHALPLLRHNLTLNVVGGAGGGGAAARMAAMPAAAKEDGCAPCCAAGHALSRKPAEHEDYVCNVCGRPGRRA